MSRASAWQEALEEHRNVVAQYVARVKTIPADRWATLYDGRTWSAADETLHLVKAYELPLGDGKMRLRVSPFYAWVLRTFYLRYLLLRKTFHRGARAPGEVRPDPDEARAMSRDDLIARLERTSKNAATVLREAEATRPEFRLVHAYFGALPPLTALRMLNAHTRHHTHD